MKVQKKESLPTRLFSSLGGGSPTVFWLLDQYLFPVSMLLGLFMNPRAVLLSRREAYNLAIFHQLFQATQHLISVFRSAFVPALLKGIILPIPFGVRGLTSFHTS